MGHIAQRLHARDRRAVVAAIGLLALGLIAVGCGSNGPHSSSAADAPQQGANRALAFASCMRSHGVPNFPDPQISRSGGHVSVKQAISINVAQAPAFKSAQRACASLMPVGGGPGGGAVDAQQRAKLLKFAVCMRSHGVSSFPDPAQGGVFHLPQSVDTSAPRFQATVQKCQQPDMNLAISQGNGP